MQRLYIKCTQTCHVVGAVCHRVYCDMYWGCVHGNVRGAAACLGKFDSKLSSLMTLVTISVGTQCIRVAVAMATWLSVCLCVCHIDVGPNG